MFSPYRCFLPPSPVCLGLCTFLRPTLSVHPFVCGFLYFSLTLSHSLHTLDSLLSIPFVDLSYKSSPSLSPSSILIIFLPHTLYELFASLILFSSISCMTVYDLILSINGNRIIPSNKCPDLILSSPPPHLFLSLSLCLSLSLSLSLSFPLCMSLSLSCTISRPMFLYLSPFLPPSLPFCLFQSLSLNHPLSLPVHVP